MGHGMYSLHRAFADAGAFQSEWEFFQALPSCKTRSPGKSMFGLLSWASKSCLLVAGIRPSYSENQQKSMADNCLHALGDSQASGQ